MDAKNVYHSAKHSELGASTDKESWLELRRTSSTGSLGAEVYRGNKRADGHAKHDISTESWNSGDPLGVKKWCPST